MAILNAIIENKGNTLIIDFPHSIYDVYEKLLSVGIRKSPNDIMLTDNEDDDIQVKLYSDSDFGNHVIRILGENNSLADANTTAYLLMTADDELKDELEQNILYDQYDSIQELTADIKKMKDMLGQFKISFFCPLDGNIEDSEYSEMQSAGNWYLKSYEWEIRELLEMEQSSPEDEMAQFFDDDESVKIKLVISAKQTIMPLSVLRKMTSEQPYILAENFVSKMINIAVCTGYIRTFAVLLCCAERQKNKERSDPNGNYHRDRRHKTAKENTQNSGILPCVQRFP